MWSLLYFVTCLAACVYGRNIRSLSGNNDFTFSWESCEPNPVLRIRTLDVSPSTVVVPGSVTINVDADILPAPAGKDNWGKMNMEVEVYKNATLFGDIKIPCINDMGSCTHRDICAKMAEQQDEEHVSKITEILSHGGVEPICPWAGGQRFTLTDYRVELPEIPAAIMGAITGRYEIRQKMKSEDGRVLSCLKLRVKVEKKQRKRCPWYNPFC